MLEDLERGDGSSMNSKRGNASSISRMRTAALLAALLATLELSVGMYIRSNALVVDGVHMLSDVLTLSIGSLASFVAGRGSAHVQYPFGFSAAESLASMTTLVLTGLMASHVLINAISRVLRPSDILVDGQTVAAVSSLATVSNGSVACILGTDSLACQHSARACVHMDSCECEATLSTSGCGKSRNVSKNVSLQAATLHVLGDLAQSICICITGIFIWIEPSWSVLDPIASMIAACFIFIASVPVAIDTFEKLMQRAPREVNLSNEQQSLLKLDGVEAVRSLRVWDASSQLRVFTARLLLEKGANATSVLQNQVLPYVRKNIRANDCTVQCEYE